MSALAASIGAEGAYLTGKAGRRIIRPPPIVVVPAASRPRRAAVGHPPSPGLSPSQSRSRSPSPTGLARAGASHYPYPGLRPGPRPAPAPSPSPSLSPSQSLPSSDLGGPAAATLGSSSADYTPPTSPFTPLPSPPHAPPVHRGAEALRRASLKQKQPKRRPASLNLEVPPPEAHRNVRFAQGSPLRGLTWSIEQYPDRLASPPLDPTQLTLADVLELEGIKQSLGTWCGQMMGSPMYHGSPRSSPRAAVAALECLKGGDGAPGGGGGGDLRAGLGLEVPGGFGPRLGTVSPVPEDYWRTTWPQSPGGLSDCDSEIFEGVH